MYYKWFISVLVLYTVSYLLYSTISKAQSNVYNQFKLYISVSVCLPFMFPLFIYSLECLVYFLPYSTICKAKILQQAKATSCLVYMVNQARSVAGNE